MVRNINEPADSEFKNAGDKTTDNNGNITVTFNQLKTIPGPEYSSAHARGLVLVPDSVSGNTVTYRVYEAGTDGSALTRVTSSGTAVNSVVAQAYNAEPV